MLNFYFLKRDWEWFLHLILYMIFQEKCFSCYSPNFIIWLPLLLEILSNRCIAIVYVPGWDIINFEIYLIFLIKRFLYMTQKSRQKFKYLNNKRAFNSSQDWVGPKRLLLPVFSSCNFWKHNPFVALMQSFKVTCSSSPKLFNLNQAYPSQRKCFSCSNPCKLW